VVVKFNFSLSKPRKQPFSVKFHRRMSNFKIQEGPCPRSNPHTSRVNYVPRTWWQGNINHLYFSSRGHTLFQLLNFNNLFVRHWWLRQRVLRWKWSLLGSDRTRPMRLWRWLPTRPFWSLRKSVSLPRRSRNSSVAVTRVATRPENWRNSFVHSYYSAFPSYHLWIT